VPWRAAPALLAGAALAFAWWDWVYPGQTEAWWYGERIYRLYQLRLAWMILLGTAAALVLWWVAGRTRAQGRRFLPFLPALLAPVTLARYVLHPFGVQSGSSVWTYALLALTAAVPALALAQIGSRRSASTSAELSLRGRSVPEAISNDDSRGLLRSARNDRTDLRSTRNGKTDLRSARNDRSEGRRGSLLVVAAAAVVYLLVFGSLSIARYDSYRAHGLDLGTMDQAAWNTLHGRILERTPLYRDPADGSRYENRLLDAKLELIFLPLSALYAVWSDPRLLLFVQTAALAAGAIPLYLLARERLAAAGTASTWPAAVLAGAYLIYLPLHYVNMADFHPSALMIPPLIAAWRAMRLRRWPQYYTWFTLALLCRVDAALVGLGVGAAILIAERGARRHGAWTVAVAGAWLALDFAVVVPAVHAAYGPGAGDLVSRRFEALGGSPLGILRTLVSQPLSVLSMLVDLDKAQALVDLLAPTGFLALLAPWALMPALPVLAVNFLSESAWQQSIHAHYMAPVIPFVWIAAVEGLAWLSRRARRAPSLARYARPGALSVFVLAYTGLVTWAFSPFPPGRAFRLADVYQPSVYEQDLRAVLAQVPPDATVCAQSDLHPHLSQRRDVALYPRCTLEPGLEAEYVVLDLDPTAIKSPVDHHTFYRLVAQWLAREDYGVVASQGSGLLLQRGASRGNVSAVEEALHAYGMGLYRVAFERGAAPAVLRADAYYRVPFALRNTGSQNWQAQGTLPVRLSYRWLDAAGQAVIEVPQLRTDLPHRVAPGHAVRLRGALLTPPVPGTYILEWDVLREGDAWFSTAGGATLRQVVQVK
jgi:uncharacterized membrane protein